MFTKTNDVPANYTELHRNYRHFSEMVVQRSGVNWAEVPDITSHILTRFFERDMLKEFDPERGVKFTTWLGGFISSYVPYLNGKSKLDWKREGVSHEVVVGKSESGEDITLYDVVAEKHHDKHDNLEYIELITAVRRHLAHVAPTNKNDKLDMVAVWDQIMLHQYEHGTIIVADIAKYFGVSLATGKNWVKRVKEHAQVVIASQQ